MMSKKNSIKRKVVVKTVPGEAVVVASAEILNHIVDTYMYMASSADNPEESESWRSVATQITEWVQKTYHSEQDQYDEEW